MCLILEISRPFCWRPGMFRSRVMSRVWWGYIAVSWLHVPMEEFATTAYDWWMPQDEPQEQHKPLLGRRFPFPTGKCCKRLFRRTFRA